MGLATLERGNSSDAEDESDSYSAVDEFTEFMAHVVGKDGLSGGDKNVDKLSGRKPNPGRRSADPPEGKPKPTEQFIGEVDELLAHAESAGSVALNTKAAVVVHGGRHVVDQQAELILADA